MTVDSLLENECVEDLMLNGLKIIQNNSLYKFTSDAVLLTRFAKAKNGDRVADFCSGSGIVGIHFYGLNPCVSSVDFFEMQSSLADMNARSVTLNGLENVMRVHCSPVQSIGVEYNCRFNVILCNPPYQKAGAGEGKHKQDIAVCNQELTLTFDELAAAAAKKLCYAGRFYICIRADRLTDAIVVLRANRLEPKRLQTVSSKPDKSPYLVLLEAVKGGASSLKIEPNLINAR